MQRILHPKQKPAGPRETSSKGTVEVREMPSIIPTKSLTAWSSPKARLSLGDFTMYRRIGGKPAECTTEDTEPLIENFFPAEASRIDYSSLR